MNETETAIVGAWLDELIVLHRAGEPVDIERKCADHPHLASELRELFDTQCALESMKADSQTVQATTLGQLHTDLKGYKVVRELARGGMGIVYEAIQLSLSRRVALKVISGHLQGKEDSVERFRREARVASQLHHSNIVPVFDVGYEGSVRFYAMQFIRGESLNQIIDGMRRQRGDTRTASPSLLERVARVGVQMADALSAAHAAGILHRDVKPANILVDDHGTAWLTDFGLATLVEDTSSSGPLTESGELLGTLRYVAPERLAGQQDGRGDIYSLAATLYEMLTLHAVVSASDRVQILQQISQHPPIPPRQLISNVPRDLETILLKGLCKDPAERYQNASELADDLRLFLLDRPIRARRASWLEVARRWVYRNPVLAGLGLVLALLLLVTLIGWQANRSLQWQRDQVMFMYQRAQMAENEARVRVLLNEVANFRATLEPELTSRRRQLELLARSNLPAHLRSELRNEIAACWMRGDWWSDDAAIEVDATRVALDRHRTRLASINTDGSVKLCDFPSLENPVVLSALNFVPQTVRFSRDGQYVIVALNSWFQLYRSQDGQPIYAGTQVVLDCDVSGQSHRAVFWHDNQRITVEAIDTQPTALILEHHADSEIEAVKLSPLGDRLAYLTESGLVIVDIPSGETEVVTDVKHSGMMEWSPDGKCLAVTDREHGIEIWDVDLGQPVVALPTLGSVIAYLDWDASSQLLASQTWDGCFQVQHAWTGKLLARTKRHVGQAEFSDDGQSLGWNFEQGQLRLIRWFAGLRSDVPGIGRSQQETPLAMAFHPTEPLMAIGTTARVVLSDLRSGRCVGEASTKRMVALGFDQSGASLNVLGTTQTESWPVSWQAEDAKCQIGPMSAAAIPKVTSGFLSVDARRAWATTVERELVEIELGRDATHRVLGPSYGLAVKRLGGPLLALYDWHHPYLEIRRTDTGEAIGRLNTGENALAFADAKGKQLITTNGKQIESWSIQDLTEPARTMMPTNVIGSQVAHTSDGNLMVVQSVPYELQLVHSSSGECLIKLAFDFSDSVTQLAFDPTDRYLVALCTRTGVVRKWDLSALNAALKEVDLNWQ